MTGLETAALVLMLSGLGTLLALLHGVFIHMAAASFDHGSRGTGWLCVGFLVAADLMVAAALVGMFGGLL